MSRIKIELPEQYKFTTEIPIRITDLNYGGHVGNDTVLSIIHEARVRYLVSRGFSELNAGGVGLIMSDVTIQFKNELFYGDIVKASLSFTSFTKVSFDVLYLLEIVAADVPKPAAIAKTGMICYDYNKKRIAAVPEVFKSAFE